MLKVMEAWKEAYNFLADLLIKRESELYEARKNAKGGWKGSRTFVVAKKEAETDTITSFYLKPKDGGDMVHFKPGQYVTIRVSEYHSDVVIYVLV